MASASMVGSFPGDSAEEYADWVRVVFGELDLPCVPELPGRGATASMTGRTLAVIAELGVDLQPAGWRLTSGSSAGIDQRRARSLLAQDLDCVEEITGGRVQAVKIQVAGPWTLAATVERPRGDRVLADHGARRELAQALAEGVRGHVADVYRRLSPERLIVQVDEPALAAVLAAEIPTASGFGRHRSVEPADASAALREVFEAIGGVGVGAQPWVHACAPGTPWGLLAGAGAQGLSFDLGAAGAGEIDQLAEALESGVTLGLGAVPSTDPADGIGETDVLSAIQRWLDMAGLDPEQVGGNLVVTPGCGLAGASAAWARRAVGLAAAAATRLPS